MIIIKVPAINGLGRTIGCELAPEAVLGQLKEIFTNEQGREIKFELDNIDIDEKDKEDSNNSIFSKAKEILSSSQNFPLFLGGDHSISCPLVKAFKSSFAEGAGGSKKGNAGILVLDAHADCMHNIEPATHEDWLRVLVEQGMKPENIFLVGIRNLELIEVEYLKKKQINCFPMKELAENLHEICDSLMEATRKLDALYLSIDIDAVDPAFAPATGYIEPAGLTSRQLIYLLQRIKLLKNLRAADLVEINPKKDINNMTSKLGAKIIAELM